MALKKIIFKNEDELKAHITSHTPTFYHSSQTSTVIPYDKIEQYLGDQKLTLGDLSNIPGKMEINDKKNLIVRGAVSWKDAREFLHSKNYNIKTSPTEELALILAGVATSCTGERCFSFGNLRSQIESLKYIDYTGHEVQLNKTDDFNLNSEFLPAYQQDYIKYAQHKNAPFPRFESAIDLMVGTEGQLGVITEVELSIVENFSVEHLFMLVPKWENDLTSHLEIIEKIQNFRDDCILCELIDANSFEYLDETERPNKGMDAIFFEIKQDRFDSFYENFIMQLDHIDEENIFQLNASKFHHIRASVPRAVFETNSKMGVIKQGTDVQVPVENFEKLMKVYQEFTRLGVRYNLFGHFGDAHLHFNFMPTISQVDECRLQLERLYHEVLCLNGSPFAEHGIGIIKQKYIKNFWSKNQYEVFEDLKKKHDPNHQFFPQGFMCLKP